MGGFFYLKIIKKIMNILFPTKPLSDESLRVNSMCVVIINRIQNTICFYKNNQSPLSFYKNIFQKLLNRFE